MVNMNDNDKALIKMLKHFQFIFIMTLDFRIHVVM